MKKMINMTLAVLLATTTLFAQTGTHKSTTPAQSIQTTKKIYTCPMHPEVTSDKPGKCPKCGMALVEKKPAGGSKGEAGTPAGGGRKKDTSMKGMKM